jgi:subtilase family serine protease
MRRILLVFIGVMALTASGAGQSPPSGLQGIPRPIIAAADRHDLSPPLRDVQLLTAPRSEPNEREPEPWRRAGPSGSLSADPVVQNFPAPAAIPAALQSIEGVANVNGVLPPDTNGDVGANHFVQSVNLSFAVYSKGSASSPPALLYGPAPTSTVWSGFGGPCETRNDGDPVIRYDHLADRWVFSQLAIPNSYFGFLFGPFYECIAVSATPDPTGAYNRYQFSFSKLNDYPKLGVWSDGYYMSMNQFTSVSLQYAGQGVVAFDRDKMLAGAPAQMVYFDLAPVDMNLGGMLPADLDGPAPPPGSPAYFAQMDDDAWGYSPDQLQLWRFHVDWANPSAASFTRAAVLSTAPFDSDLCGYTRNCIPMPGTDVKVDAIADRLMYRLQYRNFGSYESLVVNHTVDVDGTDHAGIRWYELRDVGTTPLIYQQGTYAPDGNHRWMGSAAMDAAGNLALGFSVSGVGLAPSVRFAGRLAGDPLGTITQGEGSVAAGAGSQTHASGRWGDYSMMTVDPTDGCTFWYTQEYYAGTSESAWHTRIGSFAFPSCASSSSLPAVTIAATSPAAREAGPVIGAFTVSRRGDLSQPLAVNYSVSGTATPDVDYVSLPGVLTIGAGESTGTISVTPIDDLAVEAAETVTVTLAAGATYRVSVPSQAAVSVISDDVPPDLVVGAITAPAIGGAGSAVVITETTRNAGSGASNGSATGFYLSANTLLDKSDVFLGVRPVPALAAGQSDTASTTMTIPPGTVSGTYFVLAVTDVDNVVPETQENNNVKASGPLRIGSDLIVSALTAPAAAAAGGTLSVTDTTTNQGGAAAPSSATGFYLSKDGVPDGADTLLGTRPVAALAASGSDSSTTSFVVPPAISSGLYYLIAKADATSTVAEAIETNNVKVGTSIKIGPDLVVASIVSPPIAGAGDVIAVTDATKNQGSSIAGASVTAIYLSTDVVLDTADVMLGKRSVASLTAGATDSGSTSGQIPASTATGTYFVLGKADAGNDVAESVETNNVLFASAIRIGPDLTIAALNAPSSAVAGSTIVVTDTTRNSGGGLTTASTTRFYLSANLTLDAADVLLGSRAVGPIGAGATEAGSTMVAVPLGIPPGNYYVIGVADGGGVIAETNETNNTQFAFVRITSG